MKTIFIYNSKIPKALSIFINIYGITIFPFIIFREDKELVPEDIVRHELIHIKQQKELLIVFFYFLYVYYWIKNLILFKDKRIAYKLIPFEREAYEYQSTKDYLRRRKNFFWTKYRKLPKSK